MHRLPELFCRCAGQRGVHLGRDDLPRGRQDAAESLDLLVRLLRVLVDVRTELRDCHTGKKHPHVSFGRQPDQALKAWSVKSKLLAFKHFNIEEHVFDGSDIAHWFSPKLLADGVLPFLREQVLIPLLLLGRLVAHPGVDQPLVDRATSTDRREAVPKGMPAGYERPFSIL